MKVIWHSNKEKGHGVFLEIFKFWLKKMMGKEAKYELRSFFLF